MGTAASEVARYEQRFRRAGLPLFIEDYSPTHDIFTRATPLLVLVFIAEMLGATSLDWPVWVNLLAALGGLAALVGGFGLLNGLRGRPFWSLPTRFGIPELAVFSCCPRCCRWSRRASCASFSASRPATWCWSAWSTWWSATA
jgi:hypothetical protein